MKQSTRGIALSLIALTVVGINSLLAMQPAPAVAQFAPLMVNENPQKPIVYGDRCKIRNKENGAYLSVLMNTDGTVKKYSNLSGNDSSNRSLLNTINKPLVCVSPRDLNDWWIVKSGTTTPQTTRWPAPNTSLTNFAKAYGTPVVSGDYIVLEHEKTGFALALCPQNYNYNNTAAQGIFQSTVRGVANDNNGLVTLSDQVGGNQNLADIQRCTSRIWKIGGTAGNFFEGSSFYMYSWYIYQGPWGVLCCASVGYPNGAVPGITTELKEVYCSQTHPGSTAIGGTGFGSWAISEIFEGPGDSDVLSTLTQGKRISIKCNSNDKYLTVDQGALKATATNTDQQMAIFNVQINTDGTLSFKASNGLYLSAGTLNANGTITLGPVLANKATVDDTTKIVPLDNGLFFTGCNCYLNFTTEAQAIGVEVIPGQPAYYDSPTTNFSIQSFQLNPPVGFIRENDGETGITFISVGTDKTGLAIAYKIDPIGQLYHYNGSSMNPDPWEVVTSPTLTPLCPLSDVSVDDDGNVFVVSSLGKTYKLDSSTKAVTPLVMPAGKQDIVVETCRSANATNIYAVGKISSAPGEQSGIFKYDPTNGWTKISDSTSAAHNDLAVNYDGEVYALNEDGALFEYAPTATNKTAWKKIDGANFDTISGGPKGIIFGIKDGHICKWVSAATGGSMQIVNTSNATPEQTAGYLFIATNSAGSGFAGTGAHDPVMRSTPLVGYQKAGASGVSVTAKADARTSSTVQQAIKTSISAKSKKPVVKKVTKKGKKPVAKKLTGRAAILAKKSKTAVKTAKKVPTSRAKIKLAPKVVPPTDKKTSDKASPVDAAKKVITTAPAAAKTTKAAPAAAAA